MTYSRRFRLKSLDKSKSFFVLNKTLYEAGTTVSAGLHSNIFQKKILVFTAGRISNMTQHNWIVPFFIAEGLQSSLQFQSESQ